MKSILMIFDMDNTLLNSRIDFYLMKKEVGIILQKEGVFFDKEQPVAYALACLKAQGLLNNDLEKSVWQKISAIESIGLAEAVLEPGTEQMLATLSEYFELAVLSNNMDDAVHNCLSQLAVADYFNIICGRDVVPALKPDPAGMKYIMSHFPHIQSANTIAVGDALIDAAAAYAAGIRFVAYNSSRSEQWCRAEKEPALYLTEWSDTACKKIIDMFD